MDQSSRRHGSQDICGTRRRLILFYQNAGNGKSRIIWSHCISSAYILYTLHNGATRLPCHRRRGSFGRKNARRNLNNTPQLACALWRARVFARLFRGQPSIITSGNCVGGGFEGAVEAGSTNREKTCIHPSARAELFSLFTRHCAPVQRRSRRPAKSPWG